VCGPRPKRLGPRYASGKYLENIIRRVLLLGVNGAVSFVSCMAPFFNSMNVLGDGIDFIGSGDVTHLI